MTSPEPRAGRAAFEPGEGAPRTRTAALFLAAAFAALLLLAGCGGSSNTNSTQNTNTAATTSAATTSAAGAVVAEPTSATVETVTGTSGETTATLHATTHQPKVGAPWPIASP